MYRSQLTHFGVPPLILSLYGVISKRKCEEEEKKIFYRLTQPTDSLLRHKCVQLRSFLLFNKNKNVQYRDI